MRSRILYEDKDMIVCHKPAGIATQTARVGQKDMVSEMAAYLAGKMALSSKSDKTPSSPYVGVIHRLDQPVEGILVFARNKIAAANLSRQVTDGRMEKDYYAVVCGQDIPQEEELVDYLSKDGRTNLSKVVPKGTRDAKEAKLRFQTLQCRQVELPEGQSRTIALVRIRLQTGRHHQIRVQMANRRLSLLGDYKYADALTVSLSKQMGVREISLCAGRLALEHPKTGEWMVFQTTPEGKSFADFKLEIEADMKKEV